MLWKLEPQIFMDFVAELEGESSRFVQLEKTDTEPVMLW
jgi:hypothetical protein